MIKEPPHVHLVIWDEVDSGYFIYGAFSHYKDAREELKRLRKGLSDYDAKCFSILTEVLK